MKIRSTLLSMLLPDHREALLSSSQDQLLAHPLHRVHLGLVAYSVFKYLRDRAVKIVGKKKPAAAYGCTKN